MADLQSQVDVLSHLTPQYIWLTVPKGNSGDVITVSLNVHPALMAGMEAFGLDLHYDNTFFSLDPATDIGKGLLTQSWADVAGNTYVLDGGFNVSVNGHSFDSFKAIVNGLNDQYLSQDLGGRVMVYGETELPEGNMFVEIFDYQLVP